MLTTGEFLTREIDSLERIIEVRRVYNYFIRIQDAGEHQTHSLEHEHEQINR